jgi:integrase/recombinase XerD
MPREGKAKVLSPAEFKRVIKLVSGNAYAKRDTAMLFFSFGLGLRVKEIASLNVENVLDRKNKLLKEINLKRHMTKGEKQRHIYLTHPKVRKAVMDYLDERRKLEGDLFNYRSPLFRSQKGSRFTPNGLQQLFHRMFKDAGLVGASSHSGRRTFATCLIEKGIDIKAVSRLMGHASIAMTAEYVEDNPIRLKRIAEEINF